MRTPVMGGPPSVTSTMALVASRDGHASLRVLVEQRLAVVADHRVTLEGEGADEGAVRVREDLDLGEVDRVVVDGLPGADLELWNTRPIGPTELAGAAITTVPSDENTDREGPPGVDAIQAPTMGWSAGLVSWAAAVVMRPPVRTPPRTRMAGMSFMERCMTSLSLLCRGVAACSWSGGGMGPGERPAGVGRGGFLHRG